MLHMLCLFSVHMPIIVNIALTTFLHLIEGKHVKSFRIFFAYNVLSKIEFQFDALFSIPLIK